MSKTILFLTIWIWMQLLNGSNPFLKKNAGVVMYVSKSGDHTGDGSAAHPFNSIAKAAAAASPGDKVIIAGGIYRESVKLLKGGDAEQNRITFQAALPGKVFLKGSDRQQGWKKVHPGVWEVRLDSSAFKGIVFFNGQKMRRVSSVSSVRHLLFSFAADYGNGMARIQANFGAKNPNTGMTETVARDFGISGSDGVNYISIIGINISQIANHWASIYAAQPGAVSAGNGSHWNIQDCSVSDCSGVGISIGLQGHQYTDVSPHKPEFSDLTDLASTGHHRIKNNHIFNCGQAGIFGLLGGSCSRIENNLIEDINKEQLYPGTESGGIRLAVAIDAVVEHNLIRRVQGSESYGIYLGPLIQGARFSRNIILETPAGCLFLFKSHGPVLFDNNILMSSLKRGAPSAGVKMIASEANVFIQNLFYNCRFSNELQPGVAVSTTNYLPHSLVIKQTIPALNIDHRWYANLFYGSGPALTECAGCKLDFNTYTDGALPVKWADQHAQQFSSPVSLQFQHKAAGASLSWNGYLFKSRKLPAFTPEFVGFFALSKQYLEWPDGRPLTVSHDFFGVAADGSNVMAGPFYKSDKFHDHIQLF